MEAIEGVIMNDYDSVECSVTPSEHTHYRIWIRQNGYPDTKLQVEDDWTVWGMKKNLAKVSYLRSNRWSPNNIDLRGWAFLQVSKFSTSVGYLCFPIAS